MKFAKVYYCNQLGLMGFISVIIIRRSLVMINEVYDSFKEIIDLLTYNRV